MVQLCAALELPQSDATPEPKQPRLTPGISCATTVDGSFVSSVGSGASLAASTGAPIKLEPGVRPNSGDKMDGQDLPLIDRIRAEFHKCLGVGGIAPDGSLLEPEPGSAGHLVMNPEDLAKYWLRLSQEHDRSGEAQADNAQKEAIALRVAQLMREMDLSNRGFVNLEEWVHYMLLTRTGYAGKQINSLLLTALRKNPRVLQDLQSMFEHAAHTKNGALSIQEIMDLYSKKLLHLREGCSAVLPERPSPAKQAVGGAQGSEVPAESAEQFARDIIKAMDLKGDECISYPEFMAHCLGRRKHEVKLHLYDLSAGLAQAASSWVVGQQLEGIWHTGTVVFGKEYYYAKDTVFDDPGATSFGEPTKVIHLGYTLWRQEELHEFVVNDLKPRFHRDTYDVVTNNCNHFTDRVTMYLLGRHVPEEVMQQPKWLLQSRFVRVIRPFLNWYLRDRVAAREAGKGLPPGQPRLTPGERLEAGTTVCIHPRHEGESGVILGRVADSQTAERCAILAAGAADSKRDAQAKGWSGTLFQSCSVTRAGEVDVSQRATAGICVQYFDYAPVATVGTTGVTGQVKTEFVPCVRLSVAEMSAVASERTYVKAMCVMGAPVRKSKPSTQQVPQPQQQQQRTGGASAGGGGTSTCSDKELIQPGATVSADTEAVQPPASVGKGNAPASPHQPTAEQAHALELLVARGFDEAAAWVALENAGWSLEKATVLTQLGPGRDGDGRVTQL